MDIKPPVAEPINIYSESLNKLSNASCSDLCLITDADWSRQALVALDEGNMYRVFLSAWTLAPSTLTIPTHEARQKMVTCATAHFTMSQTPGL